MYTSENLSIETRIKVANEVIDIFANYDLNPAEITLIMDDLYDSLEKAVKDKFHVIKVQKDEK